MKTISVAREAPTWLMVSNALQIKVELIRRKKGFPMDALRWPIKARSKIAKKSSVLVRKLMKPIDRFMGKIISGY
jgi:hypothetical protein